MKLDNILFWVIALSIVGYSCSKEIPPAFLAGKYDGFTYEIVDCNDVTINVRADLTKDSTYLFNCDTVVVDMDTMVFTDSIYIRIDTFNMAGMDSFFFRLDTITMDTTVEIITELMNCNEVQFEEVTFEIDSVGGYELIVNKIFDGSPLQEKTTGQYISSGFNDINFCVTDCRDSMWYHGLFVREGNELNLSWRDTLATGSGCGFLFQGVRIF
ncbi:MAG: hypothetical protein HKN51_08480 [Saprospiraceae bacterium]|nr:hypothetical protein [Saprospiraceae bacterium]